MSVEPVDTDLTRFTALVEAARDVVVFSGAGISTESGIPDFRSPGGIWSRMRPIEFSEFVASEDARRESWQRKIEVDRDIDAAAPNRGHRAVTRWVTDGKVSCVITQNIDGLHQMSGIPEDRLVELHGNGTYAHCLDCARRFELEPIKAGFEADGSLPVCDACGGLVKHATISFGQPLEAATIERAERATLGCDLFIVVGSSLVVYPAAAFPLLAARKGASLVIVNRDPTELDPVAELVLNREIGPLLGAAAGVD